MLQNIPLRYPVILVHGIIAHDRKSPIQFWGRIPQVLTELGINVFRGNTDAWGAYESNALILKSTIERALLETKTERVNIIAHSKGGIDTRYLIWNHNFGGKIASLTTICTPHLGSEIADMIYEKKITEKKLYKKALSIFGRLYGDSNPDLITLVTQMTTANMKAFNENIMMDKNVFYQSFYTAMDKASDDLMFSATYSYVKKISGDNDGLVSESSAKWGKNFYKIQGSISHAEILDYKGKKISGINIPDIYINIAEGLSRNSF